MTDDAQTQPILIEVWADLVCPWCYIGTHRLERAIAARPDAARFDVRIRSYQLRPDAPRIPQPVAQAFAASLGDPHAVEEAEERVKRIAEEDGLEFSTDRPVGNTFDIHRALHFAQDYGKGASFWSAVQDRYFQGGLNPWDIDSLVAVAGDVGIPTDRMRDALERGECAEDVRADINEAYHIGVTGVPFTVFARHFVMAGTQPVEVYADALDETVEILSAT